MRNKMVSEVARTIHRGCSDGFTLLELLVTITLVAMVVLVLSMALRLAIGAWEKGERKGDEALINLLVPRLLEKQLQGIVRTTVEKKERSFPFCGGKNGISFFTSFTPLGSGFRGIIRVTYIYEPEEKTLTLYEQVTTKLLELTERIYPLSQEYYENLEPVSRIEDIEDFKLEYSGERLVDPQDEEQWKHEWPCNSPVPPKAVKLTIGTKNRGRPKLSLWCFQVGK